MQSQLEQLEKDCSIEWQDFKISDIFEIQTSKKKFNASNVEFSGKHRYVARGESNNGIRGYITEDEKYLNQRNTISFGQDTATMFYQSESYFTGDKIKIFSPKKHIVFNKDIALIFIAAMRKAFSNFSWGSSSYNVSVLKEIKIKLPSFVDNGKLKIAFEFMEKAIAALNAERIAALNAYLSVTGLKDYTLSKDELMALNDIGGRSWGAFKIEDVLVWQKNIAEINPLHLDSLSISEEMRYPFYGQAIIDNGIIEYRHLKNDVLNNKLSKPTILIHSNNQNAVYLQTPFYLKDGHGATSVLQSDNLDKITAQFLIGAIKKVILQKYTYNAKATKIELKNTVINLPINSGGSPDYEYMRLFISAMQKVVIKEVVLFADRKINATKKIVST
jgi:hypothetical protein